jgi:antitoxin component of RelBE/YafQ-DinJ toxin-antitoxin module
MDKKENKIEDINVRLTCSLKQQYKKYCEKNKLDMSKHIREFIEKEINKCKS